MEIRLSSLLHRCPAAILVKPILIVVPLCTMGPKRGPLVHAYALLSQELFPFNQVIVKMMIIKRESQVIPVVRASEDEERPDWWWD